MGSEKFARVAPGIAKMTLAHQGVGKHQCLPGIAGVFPGESLLHQGAGLTITTKTQQRRRLDRQPARRPLTTLAQGQRLFRHGQRPGGTAALGQGHHLLRRDGVEIALLELMQFSFTNGGRLGGRLP